MKITFKQAIEPYNESRVEAVSVIKKVFDTPINSLIRSLRGLKYLHFGDSIARFDFFCYGSWNAINSNFTGYSFGSGTPGTQKSSLPNHNQRYFMSKTDTSVEYIASDATKKYYNAILPKGVNSIQIKIKSTTATNETKNQNAKIGQDCSTIFQDALETLFPNFMEVIKCTIKDYIIYGNCALHYAYDPLSHNVELKHLPFQQICLGNKNPESEFSFLFDEIVTRNTACKMGFKMIYEDRSLDLMADIVVSHLIVHKSIINDIIENHDGIDTNSFKLDQYVEILHCASSVNQIIIKNLGNSPGVFIARNGSSASPLISNAFLGYGPSGVTPSTYFGNGTESLFMGSRLQLNIYGRGAGIACLGNIMQANMELHFKNNASILALHPSIAVQLGTEINAGDATSGYLDISPGKINTIRAANTILGGIPNKASFDIISRPEQIINVASENSEAQVKRIETAFKTEIFSMFNDIGSNASATEIIERSRQAAQTFRGETSAFYCELLLPLLEKILDDIIKHPRLALELISIDDHKTLSILKDHKYCINIFSFEDEKNREAEKEVLKGDIATFANLAQLGQLGIKINGLDKSLQILADRYREIAIS